MIPKAVIDYLDEMRKHGATVRSRGNSNLRLTRKDIEGLLVIEADGVTLCKTLANHCREVEREKLCSCKREPAGLMFTVPDWRKFVAFLRLVGGAA